MDELLIPRAEKVIRDAACLDLTVNQQSLAENLKVKDHQKARESKNSRYKKKNIKTERIPNQKNMTQGQYI